jgi:hypothetical protein
MGNEPPSPWWRRLVLGCLAPAWAAGAFGLAHALPPSETATPTLTATPTRTATSTPTVPSASNCCSAHGAGGCDRDSCETCVCSADVFCCLVAWDDACLALVAGDCALDCPCVSAAVAGTIRYYEEDRPVGSVTVMASGASTATATDGTYALSDLEPGPQQIVPRKLGDLRGAVGSLDAAFAAQASVGMRTLTGAERLACDVTGNGSVSSLDAARIAQFAVGILTRLPVAALCESDWAFIPDPVPAPNQEVVPPEIGAGACEPGAIRFEPLAGNLGGQDFRAVLFGDCTGNWAP